MDFRIANEKRTMKPGDVAVIPGGVEHEGYFPEDSEAIDFFAPVREDFLTGAPPTLHGTALTGGVVFCRVFTEPGVSKDGHGRQPESFTLAAFSASFQGLSL